MSNEYLTYITEHKANVKKAYDWLVEHDIINSTAVSGELLETEHDLSKYSEEEFEPYNAYFYGTKTDKVKEEFDFAWLHHIHNNPHHWQYWVLFNDDDGTYGLEMPERYAIEMLCDWWSFSHKINKLDEIFSWYDAHKNKMVLHKNTKKFVEDALEKIKKVLEKESQ